MSEVLGHTAGIVFRITAVTAADLSQVAEAP
jgi:hypothetical protein